MNNENKLCTLLQFVRVGDISKLEEYLLINDVIIKKIGKYKNHKQLEIIFSDKENYDKAKNIISKLKKENNGYPFPIIPEPESPPE